MNRTTLLVGIALALVLAACGTGADDTEATDSPGLAEEPPAETDPETDAETDPGTSDDGAVLVSGFRFDPASLSVPVGTEVRWDNEDGTRHTATAGEPDAPTGDFDVDLPQDASGSHTFDEPGTYAYFCAVHPSMTGEVVVQ